MAYQITWILHEQCHRSGIVGFVAGVQKDDCDSQSDRARYHGSILQETLSMQWIHLFTDPILHEEYQHHRNNAHLVRSGQLRGYDQGNRKHCQCQIRDDVQHGNRHIDCAAVEALPGFSRIPRLGNRSTCEY